MTEYTIDRSPEDDGKLYVRDGEKLVGIIYLPFECDTKYTVTGTSQFSNTLRERSFTTEETAVDYFRAEATRLSA
jgi:hypothetical protein